MITLEQVEKLRQHANISYEEAKAALEKAEGDILAALIDLENQGKVQAPSGGGTYVSHAPEAHNSEEHKEKTTSSSAEHDRKGTSGFKKAMADFTKFLSLALHKGNVNAFVVRRHAEEIMRMPVTVLVILCLIAFWVVIPLLAVGLFFGFRYSFAGPDLGNSKVNDAMDSVGNKAEEIKKDLHDK